MIASFPYSIMIATTCHDDKFRIPTDSYIKAVLERTLLVTCKHLRTRSIISGMSL